MLFLKIELLKQHGFNVELPMIKEVIINPDKVDIGYKNRFIAQKIFNAYHVLRIVYEIKNYEIYVITIYP